MDPKPGKVMPRFTTDCRIIYEGGKALTGEMLGING